MSGEWVYSANWKGILSQFSTQISSKSFGPCFDKNEKLIIRWYLSQNVGCDSK